MDEKDLLEGISYAARYFVLLIKAASLRESKKVCPGSCQPLSTSDSITVCDEYVKGDPDPSFGCLSGMFCCVGFHGIVTLDEDEEESTSKLPIVNTTNVVGSKF